MYEGLGYAIIIVTLSPVWVYIDATNKRIGKISNRKGILNQHAAVWAIACLVIWPVAFPAYLVKREELIALAKQHPIIVTGKWLKALVFVVVGLTVFSKAVDVLAIQLVKHTTFKICPKHSIGEITDGYLSNPNWWVEMADGDLLVNASGSFSNSGELSNASFQYVVNARDNNFVINKFEINGKEQDASSAAAFFLRMCQSSSP